MLKMTITAIIVFVLDQVSKYWIVEAMDLKTVRSIDVFPPYLNFRMAWNHGINFGLFDFGDNGRWVLIALSVAIVAFVIMWARKSTSSLVLIGAGILVGGALGNVYDRLVYGAVADFLNMSCCGIQNPFAFNVADIAIFVGAGFLIIWGDTKQED